MQCDFLIIGAGIAGASAGYALAPQGKTIVLERESRPGYHTTGRSVATYIEFIGSRSIRMLSLGGKAFFHAPPAGFSSGPLVTPRGCLIAAVEKDVGTLEAWMADVRLLSPTVRSLSTAEALALCPILKPEAAVTAMYDPEAMDIDVNALHQGFLRGLKAAGGEVVVDAEVLGLERSAGQWRVSTPQGEFRAPVVVNAAGAWADRVAALAGLRVIGLQPKRRTVIVTDAPDGIDPKAWPIIGDAAESWYFLPQGRRILCSPADETPTDPCDAQPEELDVAITIDRIETATTLKVNRVEAKWAGLRSFVADKSVVAGFAPDAEGFFWLAGQAARDTDLARAFTGDGRAGGRPRAAGRSARHGLTEAMLAPDRLFAEAA